MSKVIPRYIVNRIRAKCPENCYIVPGSTPVVAFGDVRKASVATLGLNPSWREFIDKSGCELDGPERRLETLRSVGTSSLAKAPDAAVEKIFDGCNSYFSRRPYKTWFDKFDLILRSVDASYYDGSACHLDLIQWATNPTWRKLTPRALRDRLLADDADFFLRQLKSERIKLLLLNGRSVIRGFETASGVQLSPIPSPLDRKTTMFHGEISGAVRVIGWTINLQSSHGVSNDLIRSLARVVRRLHRIASS